MKDYKRLTDRVIAEMLRNTEEESWDRDNLEAQCYIRLADLEDKIESREIDYVADRDKQIARLTAENAELRATLSKMETVEKELRARLEKAVEPPVKVGDTVYFIPTYNGKPIWGVQRGIVQMVGITRQGYHVKIRDRADFNKTYMFRKSAFLSKEQAEARLAKLKGEKKNG